MTDPAEEEFTFIPVPEQISFDSTMVKIDSKGNRILTDKVYPQEGEVYKGMSASMANVPQYATGDTSVLDDPGSMTKLHTKQRFPVGTETVSRLSYVGHYSMYYLWTYTYFPAYKGYLFVNTGFYTNEPKSIIPPPKNVMDLYTKGGYWYKGKKYT